MIEVIRFSLGSEDLFIYSSVSYQCARASQIKKCFSISKVIMKLLVSAKLLSFLEKYKHQYIDADGHYWYQCVDLIRQYCKECFGYTMPSMAYAKDASEKHFKTPLWREVQLWKEDLEMGDIVSFKPTKNNKAGHIGIVYIVRASGIKYIDQNGKWWAGTKINGVYQKLPENGVEIRQMSRSRNRVLRAFRYIWQKW